MSQTEDDLCENQKVSALFMKFAYSEGDCLKTYLFSGRFSNFSYLQDKSAPHQVECSEDNIFVVVFPVKQVVRNSNKSHGHQCKSEVLQEAKVEGLTLSKVVPDVIWGKQRGKYFQQHHKLVNTG